MNVRSILKEEIHSFEMVGVTEGESPRLNLQRWIDGERTTLDLCFVVEDDNAFLGRIMYGFFEDQPTELKIWQIKMDETLDNFEKSCKVLVEESLKLLKDKGFSNVEYHHYFKITSEVDRYHEAFTNSGFRIVQEKKCFEYEEENFKSYKQRLVFKNLEDSSEHEFISAIEAVTYGTLDRDDLESLETSGPKRAAEMYFELLKEIDFNEEWWKLAYEQSGELVGLVVPQRIGKSTGSINYIGVVPEKRGNGYVHDLIGKASSTMFGDKMEKIVADIDYFNFPLEKALIDCGYEYDRSMTVFKLNMLEYGGHYAI